MPRTMLKDEHWTRLRPILLELNIYDKGNLRNTVEGVLYRMRVGCPWRDLPSHFGKPNTIYKAYQRWFRSNKLIALFALLIKDSDCEWVFIDGTYVKADRTIADLRESKLFIVPAAPKPEFKPRKVTQESIDRANDAVNKLKAIRLNREKAQQVEQERLRQQQIATAAQKKLEQAEQEKLERQQRREQIRERIAMETGEFNHYYQQLKQQPFSVDQSHLQKIDQNSEFGQRLVAILATDSLMQALTRYQDDPSTTKHQRTLAELQYERLGNDLISHSQAALDSSKSIRHTASRKTNTAALKGVFDAMVPEHKQNLSETQQERLQSVSVAIDDHSYDINRSRGMTLGF